MGFLLCPYLKYPKWLLDAVQFKPLLGQAYGLDPRGHILRGSGDGKRLTVREKYIIKYSSSQQNYILDF